MYLLKNETYGVACAQAGHSINKIFLILNMMRIQLDKTPTYVVAQIRVLVSPHVLKDGGQREILPITINAETFSLRESGCSFNYL